MKKTIKIAFMLTIFAVLMLFGVTVHASDSVKSSYIQTYNGKTYTSVTYLCSGKIEDSSVYSIPISVKNGDYIYSFAIYYDKIYYAIGKAGSDGVLGCIYRCNLDGSNNELIANDAEVLSSFYLSDGCIYYQVYYDYDNYYGRYLNGGVMMINLNTGWYGKIITDYNASLTNVLDDKVFYWAGNGYHLMTARGRYIGKNDYRDVEVYADVVVGDAGYKGDSGVIYKYDWNRNAKWICNVTRYVDGRSAHYQYPYVVNVTGGYIYYSIGFTPKSYYNASPNTAMYKVPISGGNSTLVAKWYTS